MLQRDCPFPSDTPPIRLQRPSVAFPAMARGHGLAAFKVPSLALNAGSAAKSFPPVARLLFQIPARY